MNSGVSSRLSEPQYSRLSERPERTRQAECLKKEMWIYYYYNINFKVFIVYFPLSPVHDNNLEILPPPRFISIPVYSCAGAILICIKTHNIQNTELCRVQIVVLFYRPPLLSSAARMRGVKEYRTKRNQEVRGSRAEKRD